MEAKLRIRPGNAKGGNKMSIAGKLEMLRGFLKAGQSDIKDTRQRSPRE